MRCNFKLHCGSFPLDSYLSAKCHTVGANSLTKPLTERLSDGLQTFHYILSWVHSAILFAGQYGCQTVMTSRNFICHREFKTNLEIRSQVSGRLVTTGGEISPQLLNGGHSSSGDTIFFFF